MMKRKAWKKYPDKDMRLFSFKDYMTFAKGELIEYITMALTELPKRKLARLAYNLTKAKLPRLKKIPERRLKIARQLGRKGELPLKRREEIISDKFGWNTRQIKRKTKRKFSRKQLAWQKEFARKAKAGIFSPKHPSRLKRRRR
jgi:hypothetical protein